MRFGGHSLRGSSLGPRCLRSGGGDGGASAYVASAWAGLDLRATARDTSNSHMSPGEFLFSLLVARSGHLGSNMIRGAEIMYIFMASQFFPLKDVMMEEPFILFILQSCDPYPPPQHVGRCHCLSRPGQRVGDLSAVTQPVSGEAESSSWVI